MQSNFLLRVMLFHDDSSVKRFMAPGINLHDENKMLSTPDISTLAYVSKIFILAVCDI